MLQGTEDPSPMARHGQPEPIDVGPAAPADRPAADRPAADPPAEIGASILVVDDDPHVLAFVSRILRGRGHEVTAVGSGRQALRAVVDGRSRPAMLLTDIDMPAMTGIELAARIVALRPGIAVVMMTGDPASAALARDRPDQVAGVLIKPFSLSELVDAVAAAAGRRSER
jgi:CheY-like chemotaxis protein